jgi:hypothetical protein
VKAVGTVLAIVSAIITTLTYAILIDAGARMTGTSKLPLVSIASNISTILALSWPETSDSSLINSKSNKSQNVKPDAIRLFYVGRMGDGERRIAKGVLQCEAVPAARVHTSSLWLTGGSPTTTCIVQIFVWEWVIMWLTITMIITTVLFNGFFTDRLGPDSWVRLTVVLMYSAAYCVHVVYVWKAFTDFLTMVSAGSAWSMLNRANFAVVSLMQFERRLRHPTEQLDFKIIDKASAEFVPATYSAVLAHDTDNEDVRNKH